jgi:signal transduction histidine kinase
MIKKYDTLDKKTADKYLQTMNDELARIKELTENYLQNFRSSNNNKIEINTYLLLQSIEILLKHELEKKNINFNIDNNLENFTITFNSMQIRQIFINLIYNSIEAGSKNIKIFSDNANIYIEDDGLGIDSIIREKLFLPFFSTKLEGTGLGLSISKEIMNEHLGNIELVESQQGKTVFKLSFEKDIL